MKIHPNPYYLSLVLVICVITLFFSGTALYKYYDYVILNKQAQANILNWSVVAKNESEYFIKADYEFFVLGKQSFGETLFSERYLNSWAAEQSIKQLSAEPWVAWYQQGNPNHSTLQKKFPYKECISALALVGLLLYFVWLGTYVTKFRT